MRFLFWNAAKNPATSPLIASAPHDLILIAEPPSDLATSMEATPLVPVTEITPGRVVCYFRPSACYVEESEKRGDRRCTIYSMVVGPKSLGLTLVGVHLVSKQAADHPSQDQSVRRLAEQIAEFEDQRSHQRTVVLGDLNLDPFEPPLTDHYGMNAVMCAATAAHGGGVRVHEDVPRRTFYNPMWSLLGDRSDGPPGSHFYNGGGSARTFWHAYDQVLIRPGLAAALSDVRFLVELGGVSLVTDSGRPCRTRASDHLPIEFTLDLESHP